MKIVYQGPLTTGFVRAIDGTEYIFERGKPIEVADRHASEILANPEWKEVDTP